MNVLNGIINRFQPHKKKEKDEGFVEPLEGFAEKRMEQAHRRKQNLDSLSRIPYGSEGPQGVRAFQALYPQGPQPGTPQRVSKLRLQPGTAYGGSEGVQRNPTTNEYSQLLNRKSTKPPEEFGERNAHKSHKYSVATMASTAENTPENESIQKAKLPLQHNGVFNKLRSSDQKKPKQLVEYAVFLKANSIFSSDTLENILRNIVVNLQHIQIINMFLDPKYQEYIKNLPVVTNQTGGYDVSDMDKVRKSLDYLLSDSYHDFGKGRNRYFPHTIYANMFADVKHEKIQALIKNIYHGAFTERDNPDFLLNYLLKSKFEEQVKVDFLTGELVGDIPDISYFFSENGPDNWPSTRKKSIEDAIIGEIARTKMGEVINETSVGDWYYIYDACVPGRIHANIGGKQALTLAKIWDPSKAGKISKRELFESNNTKTTLISQGTNSHMEKENRVNYTIFDWVTNTNEGKSLYDEIYDDLLHINTLPNKSLIKLRLAVSDDEMCSLCIKIADKYFIIDSGFSVNELSAGIYYVEMSGKIKQTVEQTTQLIKVSYLPPDMSSPSPRILKLVEIIDELKDHMNTQQIISTLLRFKSSGDHGQSKMCQIINHELKEFCMFVSGDNLACVDNNDDAVRLQAEQLNSPLLGLRTHTL